MTGGGIGHVSASVGQVLHLSKFLRALAGASALMTMTLYAEAPLALSSLVERSRVEMESGQWNDALATLQKAIDDFGQNTNGIGPQFGVVYYRKGLCEGRLGRWEAARQSFEECYTRFPNRGATDAVNPVHKLALFEWANATMQTGQYEEAIRIYRKFLQEHDPAVDRYPQGLLYLNLAICHFRTGKLIQGQENLEIALRNKATFQTPVTEIIATFQDFVETAVGERNEGAILEFLSRNPAALVVDALDAPLAIKVFFDLGSKAKARGLDRAALALFALMPDCTRSLEELQLRLKESDTVDAEMARKVIHVLKTEGRLYEASALVAIGALHERGEDLEGALTIYERIETAFSDLPSREQNLVRLVRVSASLGDVKRTEDYGQRFEQLFPASPLLGEVRQRMLTAPFYQSDYEQATQVATRLKEILKQGTPEHDLCLYVLGVSLYSRGAYDQAQPILDAHATLYPEGQQAMSAAYFQAAAHARRKDWAKAAELFDAFLKRYPDASKNFLLPRALLDRADCYVALGEANKALDVLERIEREFGSFDVRDTAYLRKGRILLALDDPKGAEEAFKQAQQLAETTGDAVTEKEAKEALSGMATRWIEGWKVTE